MIDESPEPPPDVDESIEGPTRTPPHEDDNPTPPLEGELIPVNPELEPPPVVDQPDNTDAEAALAFLEAGMPLQDGTPDNPAVALAEARKAE